MQYMNAARLCSGSLASCSGYRHYADAAEKTSTKTEAPAPEHSPENEWTEVVDQGTGQTYYWNEKTGENETVSDAALQPARGLETPISCGFT